LRTVTSSSSPGRSPAGSHLYLITPVRPDLRGLLEAAIAGGVDIVQVRERGLKDAALLEALVVAREVTGRHDVPLVVNDRPDLAVLCEADLVHVGHEDIPVTEARRFGVGVGFSTHAPSEIDAADAGYIGVGPVYATPTKEGRPPVGLELVEYAAKHARQPWFAIGGIDEHTAPAVVAAGATRLSVLRAIVDAPDPERAARSIRAALTGV